MSLLSCTRAAQPAATLAAAPARPAAELRELGKLLFFEPALSGNGRRSCASCHRPEKAFTDHRITSRALRFTANLTRNSPTLLEAAGQRAFFHDGRAGSLADVVGLVLNNPQELGSSYALATERLAASPEYRRAFAQTTGGPVSAAGLNAALAAYVESLSSHDAPYDRARRGQALLPADARAGERLFSSGGAQGLGCAGCHGGPAFRDGRRYEVRPGDWVKTPTLRNVALTMPYNADGQAATLPDVLHGAFHTAHRPRALAPAQETQLLAFLAALTDTASAEHRPPSRLPDLPALPDRQVGGLY